VQRHIVAHPGGERPPAGRRGPTAHQPAAAKPDPR
jgi:hypothetical protein